MTTRTARPFAIALLAAIALSCESAPPTASPVAADPDALLTAATMLRTADSLVLGGNSDAAGPFGDAGAALAVLGRSVAVRVTENGTVSEYRAVAQRYVLPAGACTLPPVAATPGAAPRPIPMPIGCLLQARPVLLLWKGTLPERVIMVSAPDGASLFGTPVLGVVSAPPGAIATSMIVERPGFSFWFATAGSVNVGAPSVTGTCAVAPKLPAGVAGTCTTGTIDASFDITYGIRFPITDFALWVAPHIRLDASTIPAIVVTITNAGPVVTPVPPDTAHPPVPPPSPTTPPPSPTPPVGPMFPPLPGSPLVGRLDARRDTGGVVLTLTVANLSRDSLRVQFTSGQTYDFAIRGPDREYWRWSADKSFLAAARTIGWAPGEVRTYTERWAGPLPSPLNAVAIGWLTSTNYRIESVAPVVGPP